MCTIIRPVRLLCCNCDCVDTSKSHTKSPIPYIFFDSFSKTLYNC